MSKPTIVLSIILCLTGCGERSQPILPTQSEMMLGLKFGMSRDSAVAVMHKLGVMKDSTRERVIFDSVDVYGHRVQVSTKFMLDRLSGVNHFLSPSSEGWQKFADSLHEEFDDSPGWKVNKDYSTKERISKWWDIAKDSSSIIFDKDPEKGLRISVLADLSRLKYALDYLIPSLDSLNKASEQESVRWKSK